LRISRAWLIGVSLRLRESRSIPSVDDRGLPGACLDGASYLFETSQQDWIRSIHNRFGKADAFGNRFSWCLPLDQLFNLFDPVTSHNLGVNDLPDALHTRLHRKQEIPRDGIVGRNRHRRQ
jgi:hypothetical protein